MSSTKLETALADAQNILLRTESIAHRDDVTDALRHVLRETIDILRGATLTHTANLPVTSAVAARALLERAVLSSWIATNPANAREFVTESRNELARQLRKLLDKSFMKTRDAATGADTTRAALNESALSQIRPRRGMEEMARGAGVEDIFSTFYGWISMLAHGNTFDLPVGSSEILPMAEDLAVASATTVSSVTFSWCNYERRPAKTEIYEFFGIGSAS